MNCAVQLLQFHVEVELLWCYTHQFKQLSVLHVLHPSHVTRVMTTAACAASSIQPPAAEDANRPLVGRKFQKGGSPLLGPFCRIMASRAHVTANNIGEKVVIPAE